MPGRLVHLNGPPGIGKSTLARRWAEGHPGTLCCDVDVLRTMVGGWREDFAGTGEAVRATALAMITAYVAGGRDVVLPQLIARESELARFAAAAAAGGGTHVHVVLTDERDAAVARFYRRRPGDPHHDVVLAEVERQGGAPALAATHDRLTALAAATPGTLVVPSAEGDEDATYAALVAAVGGAVGSTAGSTAGSTVDSTVGGDA